jgi:omega-6 fatty acid desaturase (delta-12 desaturase)
MKNISPIPTTKRELLAVLPPSVFQKNAFKAWGQVMLSVIALILCYIALAIAPWYLLPPLWFFTGTVLTGWFVIGHDCGHRSFSHHKWVNDWVGHIMFLPLLYPFHSWRIGHNHHHRYTNLLEEDNAWTPFTPEFYAMQPLILQKTYRLIRGKLWFLGSIFHWLDLHFTWWKFKREEQKGVLFSVLLVLFTAVIVLPLCIYYLGVWGWVKFWLLPWLSYHFWMSTFTLVHHTDVNIPFRPRDDWNEVEAQLMGSVHCDYPFSVEWLCHHINVHIPHHISPAIPSYHLRSAYEIIKSHWQPYCQESTFSWALINRITSECHLYDPIDNYKSLE